MASKRSCTIFLLLFLHANVTHPWKVEEASKTANQFVESNPSLSWNSGDDSLIWMEYEFNTGAGNREELVVTDISVHDQGNLPNIQTKWQYLDVNGTSCLLRADESTLWFYKFDVENVAIYEPVKLDADGKILTLKAINLYPESDIVAVLCVETRNGISLRWYKLINGKSFQLFWSWPVQKHIKDIIFIQHEEPKKLLLFDEDETHFGQPYSPIDVYGVSIDFSTNAYHFWLCQRTLMPTASDIQMCSIYESISLALRTINGIFLYEYKNTSQGSIFRKLQTIKSHNLNNFVCFESGYLQFLAISGPEAALFHFEDDEFKFNVESEAGFDFSDISWVKDVKLNTYRDESLLLLQLKNSTVIALAWQGMNFKKITLPNESLDQFNLSMVTPLPKFGFVFGNQFVKLHTELRNVKHPNHHITERLLALQRLLNDTLNSQEKILDETESSFEKSYLKNPTITGVWNLSTVNTTNAVISNDVTFHSVVIGTINLTKEELEFDANDFHNKLKDLERMLDEIDSNLGNAVSTNLTDLRFDTDVEILGNINIAGTLDVENLDTASLNDIDIARNSDSNKGHGVVEGKKKLDSIEAENLTFHSLNGIPIDNIRFGESTEQYTNVDFSKVNRAHVGEHVFFSTINEIHWANAMKSIVWKNKPMLIPENTIIEGTVSADIIHANIINNLLYPENYIIAESESIAIVQGSKSFDTLLTPRLENISTLNGIDFDDFIHSQKDNALKEEITFENLIVEGLFQVDGEITELDMNANQLLNETSKLLSDVSFLNLNVFGNVTFNTFFMNKRPLNLRDLLLRNEENVEITGKKTFFGNVELKSNVTITSGMVNGHFLNEFVTMDTDQELPILSKISPNVSFGNITFGAMEKLEAVFNENANSTKCLEKIIVFKSPITLDQLSFNNLKNDVSYEHFVQKLDETFQNIIFHNLTVDSLLSEQMTPRIVNGVDFGNLTEDLELSKVISNYAVDNLETDHLNVSSINGMSLDEINQLNDKINTILEIIRKGNGNNSKGIDTLRVTGKIKTNSINGKIFTDLQKGGRTATTIFTNHVSITNLTILGSMNGYNFSTGVTDTALKTDTNIIINGYKIFDNINCHMLNVTFLNGRDIENILDPSKEQVFSGPFNINGSITIFQDFNTNGNIGNISFQDLMDRFKSLGNNTFQYHGHVQFSDKVTVDNLYTNRSIQDRNLDSFMKSVIRKVEDNVTISGTKVFQNMVVFNDAFVVRDKLNDIDLKRFHEKAVFVNEPFSIGTKIILRDGIKLEADLTVESSLETKSVMDIDVNELKLNALYLNRPSYIEETTILTSTSFLSDIKIETFNNLDMKLLIPLNTDQAIPVEALACRNVTVDKLRILGQVNGEEMQQIQENTFTVTGKQNITGHFHFIGDVHVRRNFNPRLLNGVDSTRFISLNSKSSIVGNLVFESPVYFNQSLRILSYLNGIDPARWEAIAVTANNSLRQIISGSWSILGNVYFENGAFGSDILNGTNITDASITLATGHLEMDDVLTEKRANLESACDDLNHYKHFAEKQVYRFNTFDYLQVIDFDYSINSVHYFELDDLVYLMLSFNSCNVHTYLFNGRRFELVADVPDFGMVEKWSTFKHDQTLYFLTKGPRSCGRGPVNLWKVENDEFKHVLDLGDNIENEKMSEKTLLMLLERKDQIRSAGGLKEDLIRSISSLTDDDDVKIVLEENQMQVVSKRTAYKYNVDNIKSTNTNIAKFIKKPEILNFKAGLLQKEMFLYYDEEFSKDRIIIWNNDVTRKEILQTIKAHNPSSFEILNLKDSIQTLLVFVENKNYLRFYEYKGVEGFVYEDSIRMNVDKLVSFKIRKYINLTRRYCLAITYRNILTILEARMYGEKLDMGMLTCSKH